MFSYILPFHSDFHKIPETVRKIEESKDKFFVDKIILAHNGFLISENESLKLSNLSECAFFCHTDVAGIGAGYRLGIKESNSTYTILSASDLPFGFTDIESFMKLNPAPVVAIGSKWAKGSSVSGYGPLRKLSSLLFWVLRRILLGKKSPRDSQGTIIVRTDIAKRVLGKVKSNNYFFSLEFLTLLQREGFDPVEVSVKLENHSRESSVSLTKDGFGMIRSIWDLKQRL